MLNTDVNFWKGKKVAVTGGSGFIGSWLTERLVRYEAKITVVDNLFTGCKKKLERCR